MIVFRIEIDITNPDAVAPGVVPFVGTRVVAVSFGHVDIGPSCSYYAIKGMVFGTYGV